MAADRLQHVEDRVRALAHYPHPQGHGLIGETQEFAGIKSAVEVIIMKTLHRHEISQYLARILRGRKYRLVEPYLRSQFDEGLLEHIVGAVEDDELLLQQACLDSREETVVVVVLCGGGDRDDTIALPSFTSWAELRTLLAEELGADPSQVQLRLADTDQRVDDLSAARAALVAVDIREDGWRDTVRAWPDGELKSFVLMDLEEWAGADEFPRIVELVDRLLRPEHTRGQSSGDASIGHEIKGVLCQATNPRDALALLRAEFDE